MNESEKVFEPTQKYRDSIQEIRRLPQESDEEKLEKKERVRDFRMEVMLENARLTRNAITKLEENPALTAEDLEASLYKEAEFFAHPQVVKNFVNALQEARYRIQATLERIGNGKDPALEVFEQLVGNSNHELKGKIKLDTSYPLAIILFVEDKEDYKIFDKKSSGGFYVHSHEFNFEDSNLFAPVIVMHSSGSLIKHEKGHAENARFTKSLRASGRKNLWLLEPSNFDEKKHSLVIESWSERDGYSEFSLEKYQFILDFALECAKDEILADFNSSSNYIKAHLEYLKKQGGLYDYFKQFGLSEDTKAYQALWEAYNKQLDEAFNSLDDVLFMYKKWSLEERIQLMRWVVAPIPLKDWSKQLAKTGFTAEANMLFKLLGKRTYDDYGKLTQDFSDLAGQLTSNQFHSLVPLIEKFANEHGLVLKKTE